MQSFGGIPIWDAPGCLLRSLFPRCPSYERFHRRLQDFRGLCGGQQSRTHKCAVHKHGQLSGELIGR